MHHITIRDQVCNVMASLTKTFFVRPEIVLQNLEAITACRLHLYTETLVHINLFACEKVTPAHEKSQFYLRFCRSTLISCEKRKIAILPQVLPIDPHFVRKGCSGTRKMAILHQFLPIDHHFVRKDCSGTRKIAILHQFLPIDHHFVRKGCSGTRKIAI